MHSDSQEHVHFLCLTYEHQGLEHHIAVELPRHRIKVGSMQSQPLEQAESKQNA